MVDIQRLDKKCCCCAPPYRDHVPAPRDAPTIPEGPSPPSLPAVLYCTLPTPKLDSVEKKANVKSDEHSDVLPVGKKKKKQKKYLSQLSFVFFLPSFHFIFHPNM